MTQSKVVPLFKIDNVGIVSSAMKIHCKKKVIKIESGNPLDLWHLKLC